MRARLARFILLHFDTYRRVIGGAMYLALVAGGYFLDYALGFTNEWQQFAYVMWAAAYGVYLGHRGERDIIRERISRIMREMRDTSVGRD